MIIANFNLQVTPMLPIKFRVNWTLSSEEEAKNSGHLGFLIRTVYLVLIYKSLRCCLPSFESTDLSVQEKKRKIDFQDCRHGGYFGFPIGTTLGFFLFFFFFFFFDLQVNPTLPTMFRVHWPKGVGGVVLYIGCSFILRIMFTMFP